MKLKKKRINLSLSTIPTLCNLQFLDLHLFHLSRIESFFVWLFQNVDISHTKKYGFTGGFPCCFRKVRSQRSDSLLLRRTTLRSPSSFCLLSLTVVGALALSSFRLHASPFSVILFYFLLSSTKSIFNFHYF